MHVFLLVCASGFARGLSVDSAAGAVYRIIIQVYRNIIQALDDKDYSSKQSKL